MRPHEVARAPQLHVHLGEFEPIVCAAHGLETAASVFGQFIARHQDAVTLFGPASDAPSQLVQLRQPKALRTFNHHHRSIRNVHPHFDDRGGDHNVRRAVHKPLHLHVLRFRLHAPVDNADAVNRQRESPRKAFVPVHQVLVIQGGAFLNQWIDHVDLSPPLDFVFHELKDREACLVGAVYRLDGLPAGGHFIDDTHIQVTVSRHRQGPRDGRSRHDQHMRGGIGLGPQFAPLGNSESVLLIDDRQTQILELHAGFNQGVSPYEKVNLTAL